MNDEESAKRKDNIFYVLILELILHDFHYILLTISVSPIPCEKGLYKGMDPMIQESLRSKVEADYHVQLEFLPASLFAQPVLSQELYCHPNTCHIIW